MLPDNYFESFQHRIVLDALSEATQAYWLRRAIALESARHRSGVDYVGCATHEELRTRWTALTEAAAACRARAGFGLAPEVAGEFDAVLAEVAA